jgi:hypothetical protein
MKYPQLDRRMLVAFVLSVMGIFFRLKNRAVRDLWTDEHMQLAHMQGSFADMLRTLPQREYFGYLEGDFYLVYPFFKMFGYNKWGLMIPHLLATIVGFYFLYLICNKYLRTVSAFTVCFAIVAFNATLIQHALEIRYYAVFPTLALAFFYFGDKFFSRDFILSRNEQLGFGALAILFIWFHVYGIFAVGLMTIYFLGTKCREEGFSGAFLRTLKFFTVILAIALPFWIYNVCFNHLQYNQRFNLAQETYFTDPRHVYQFIPNPIEHFFGFLKSVFANLVGYKWFYPLCFILPISWVLVYSDRSKQIGLFLTLIVLPISLLNYLDVKNGYWFVQRQFIWTMPLFAFLIAWCLESIVIYIKRRG